MGGGGFLLSLYFTFPLEQNQPRLLFLKCPGQSVSLQKRFPLFPALPQAPLRRGFMECPPPAWPSRASPLVFLALLTRGKPALPQDKAGQVELSGQSRAEMHLQKPNYTILLKRGSFACDTIKNQICQKCSLAMSDTFAHRNPRASHEQRVPQESTRSPGFTLEA